MKKDLYNQRNWLEDQYSSKKKGVPKIAVEFGYSQGAIYYWLHKYKISARSRSEATRLARSNHIILSEKALEFLTGDLLGDGHLEQNYGRSARYSHGGKYLEYERWLSKTFAQYGIEQCGIINKQEKDMPIPNGVSHIVSYFYSSRTYVELMSLHSKWYRRPTAIELKKDPRRRYMKKVPTELELTPLVCRQWYIGDGCLVANKRSYYIKLNTYGFLDNEVERLVDLLVKLGFESTKQASRVIRISTYSTQNFLDFVGPCPKEISSIYRYKWSRIES